MTQLFAKKMTRFGLLRSKLLLRPRFIKIRNNNFLNKKISKSNILKLQKSSSFIDQVVFDTSIEVLVNEKNKSR